MIHDMIDTCILQTNQSKLTRRPPILVIILGVSSVGMAFAAFGRETIPIPAIPPTTEAILANDSLREIPVSTVLLFILAAFLFIPAPAKAWMEGTIEASAAARMDSEVFMFDFVCGEWFDLISVVWYGMLWYGMMKESSSWIELNWHVRYHTVNKGDDFRDVLRVEKDEVFECLVRVN